MKVRLFFAIGLLVLLCLPAGLALADNGPHGDYTAITDACAGCHRAHTASAAMLLIDTVPNLCYTCHGTGATGADTDVADGIYDGWESGDDEGVVGRGLKAGGFINSLMDTDFDDTATLTTTTSSHTVDGSLGTAWGNDGPGTPGAANFSLSCVTCHDPHGGASTTGGATYRLLRSTLPITSTGGLDIADETPKVYTVSDVNNKYFGEGYPFTPGSTWSPMESPDIDLTNWCSECHTRYLAPTGSGSGSGSNDTIYTYLHMSQNTPVGNCTDYCHDWSLPPPFLKTTVGPEWHHDVECMTCHVAHGTSATMVGYAGSTDFVPWPDGALSPDGDNRSSLLRGDNRGVCQRCHGK